MKRYFPGTKVLMLIIILIFSSFGVFATGSTKVLKNDMETMIPTDKGPTKVAMEHASTEFSSRATGPIPGSWILNDGDPTLGYFLGKIDPVTKKNSHSTLDNYMNEDDLDTPSVKDTPAYPGTVDIEFDLTIESRRVRDDDGTNGDEMLYHLRVRNDYNDVQIKNKTTMTWSTITSPFYEGLGSESNIYDTASDAWINNNLTINGMPAALYNPNFGHGNSRHIVSENNTVAMENYVTGTGGSGTHTSVWTAEAYNNTVSDEYVDNQADTMLNATGDMTVNPPEYKDLIRINTGPKVFEGFTLDVSPDADPGVYRFKVAVEYDKQTYAPFPTSGMEDGIAPGNLHSTDAFGDFEPYFWVPWNVTSWQPVTNLTQYNRDKIYGDVQFRKVPNYLISGGSEYDVDQLDGKSSWEPIADNSTNAGPFARVTPLAYYDYDEDDMDSSSDEFEMYNYAWRQNPTDPPIPGNCSDQFVTKWNATYHLDTGDDVTNTFPKGYPIADHDYSFLSGGANDGNGTWQNAGLDKAYYQAAVGGPSPPNSHNYNGNAHAGFEDHIVMEHVTEEYWVQVTIFAPEPTPPKVPANLSVEPLSIGDALKLTWDANSGDDTTKYEVYWAETTNGSWNFAFDRPHPVNNHIFTSEYLIDDIEYFFKIRAMDKDDEYSLFSGIVEVTHKDFEAPGPPTNLRAFNISESSLTLAWDKGAANDIIEYEILISSGNSGSGGPYTTLAFVSSIKYELNDLKTDTSYYFVVKAFDEAYNPSIYSNETHARTKPLPRPGILKTYPLANSTGIPLNITVAITFDMAMDTSSVAASINITQHVDHTMSWRDNDTVLYIDFSKDLSADTVYTVTISDGKGENGEKLRSTPYSFKFRTVEKSTPGPEKQSIGITSHSTNDIINSGSTVTVTGTSDGFEPNSTITITIDGNSYTTTIGEDGSWSVEVSIPDEGGDHDLTVTAGDQTEKIRLTVVSDPDPDGTDGKDEEQPPVQPGGSSSLIMVMLSIIIVMTIIIVTLLYAVKKLWGTSQEAVYDDRREPMPEGSFYEEPPLEEPLQEEPMVDESMIEEPPAVEDTPPEMIESEDPYIEMDDFMTRKED